MQSKRKLGRVVVNLRIQKIEYIRRACSVHNISASSINSLSNIFIYYGNTHTKKNRFHERIFLSCLFLLPEPSTNEPSLILDSWYFPQTSVYCSYSAFWQSAGVWLHKFYLVNFIESAARKWIYLNSKRVISSYWWDKIRVVLIHVLLNSYINSS